MIGFEWPWLILLLPLPYFIYRYARPFNVAMNSALRVPFLDDFVEAEPGIRNKNPALAVMDCIIRLVPAGSLRHAAAMAG